MSKAETAKNIDHYLGLRYTTTLRKEDDVVIARIKELPGCVAHGDSAADAYQHLLEVQRLWIEERLSAGLAVPEPVEEDEDLPSGKWLQRVPRTLHKKLVDRADRDGVSLNALVTAYLSEAIGRASINTASTMAIVPAMGAHRTNQALWNAFPERVSQDWVMIHAAPGHGLLKQLHTTQRLITDASRNPEEIAHHSHQKGRELAKR